jgi:hypothetical protein
MTATAQTTPNEWHPARMEDLDFVFIGSSFSQLIHAILCPSALSYEKKLFTSQRA